MVVAEMEEGRLTLASRELLGKGRELADQLGVWLMAYTRPFPSDDGKEIISYGADLLFRTPSLEKEPLQNLLIREADLISKLISEKRPEIVLFTASDRSTAVAARVAQRFLTGLVTGCTALALDLSERRLLASRPVDGGKRIEEYSWPAGRPQMAVLVAGLFPEGFSDPYREGKIEVVTI